MLALKNSHLKTGEELEPQEILGLIEFAIELKKDRKAGKVRHLLPGKTLALVFDKPSLRTRFSFAVAMNELGGFSVETSLQTRKKELPEDMARVLSGYCHGIVVRTHCDEVIEKMASVSNVPLINGLSEHHHPCQIIADLMTLFEVFGGLRGLTLAYIGDGNNILNSLLLLAPVLGLGIHYSCPMEYQPNAMILKIAQGRAREFSIRIASFESPEDAVFRAQGVYTDVWTSMGFEKQKKRREESFLGFQVNEALLSLADPQAVVMHCLPMERGQEISWGLPDTPNSVIFQQSENRLHLQKALLVGLLSRT